MPCPIFELQATERQPSLCNAIQYSVWYDPDVCVCVPNLAAVMPITWYTHASSSSTEQAALIWQKDPKAQDWSGCLCIDPTYLPETAFAVLGCISSGEPATTADRGKGDKYLEKKMAVQSILTKYLSSQFPAIGSPCGPDGQEDDCLRKTRQLSVT